MQDYRHTKIIATIGPATESPEKLAALIEAGVDVMRLNMAHGTPEWVGEIVGRIRAVSKKIQRHVAVMMDVKGPEIRTGAVEENIELKPGDELVLFTSDCPDQSAREPDGTSRVSVNYPGLPGAIDLDSTILVDSGLLHWHVVSKDATTVRCRVITPDHLRERLKTVMDPLPIWYAPLEHDSVDGDEYP
ncbi:MAG: pyruvate kinase, partial [Rhodopirellula sp. JB055]|uniref:pyruvate kinase n=1 Tax=Rhodopirellula sp. JB055 TaxID=3342846 RepID=UPI00370AA495